MALSEKTEVERCDILSDGTIIARNVIIIERDGVEISREKAEIITYQKNADVSEAPDRVKNIAAKLW